LRANIDPQRATPSAAAGGARSEGTETTHYSIVDADGNAVSCTTTLNNDFGSAVTVAGAGFLLNDEMDDFMTAPGKPNLFGLVQGEANAIAPGKRMLSAMTPSMVLDPTGRLLLVLGSPGGSRIPTAVYQVISDVIDQEMPLPSAVATPRLHHQAVPDTLHLERDGFVQAAIDSLEAMGHPVGLWNYKTEVNAIVIAAPLGITTSMSRDARAAAAPAAAPAAPPITAPFVFFPKSLPTIAPATAPPATLAASAFVTPRPFMTVSIATTEASIE